MRPSADLKSRKSGFLSLSLPLLILLSAVFSPTAWAEDGATEALKVRLYAERAILQEQQNGSKALAGVMQELLPDMLLEQMRGIPPDSRVDGRAT